MASHLTFRIEHRGAHVHAQVFAGKDVDHLAKVGDLVFRLEEWDAFQTLLWNGLTADTNETTLLIEGPRG